MQDALQELASLGMRCDFFLLGKLFDVNVVHCSLSFTDTSVDEQPNISFGWGAHDCPAIAVSRALCEAVQVYAVRKAFRAGSIPESRVRPGLIVSREQHLGLGSDSAVWEHALHLRMASNPVEAVALDFGSVDTTSSASSYESWERIVALMRRSNVSHLLSWTLSPADRPFSVVKCVIPEFEAFVP